MSRTLLAVAFALLSLVVAPKAYATTYSVNFCARYSVEFEDSDSSYGDDYLTSNADLTARGVELRVKDLVTNADVYFDFTDWTGGSAGCTGSLSLDSTRTYRVSIRSRASVNGNTIIVLDDDTSSSVYSYVAYSAYAPSSSSTVYMSTSVQPQWNIAAAAGHAMYRRNAGLSGKTLTLYTQQCPTSGGSCLSGGAVYIESASENPGSAAKYVIVHEMGHLVAWLKNGNSSASQSYGAPMANCYTDNTRSHEMNSKEYVSAAANEGIAHYYAAVAFNVSTESNCKFRYYKTVDWDLDTILDSRTANCQGAPMSGLATGDYFGDLCTGTSANRGVEYDWLRMFWDLDNVEGLSTTTIFNIWDESDPDSWNATGDGANWTCLTTNYPSGRLACAASDLSVYSSWTNQWDDNGAHR